MPKGLQEILDNPPELRTPEEDIQDSKDARRNKRIQELQRTKVLNRGNIWLSNDVMPIELQPKAAVYRVMAKTTPRDFWPLHRVMRKIPPKLYCDSPSCKAVKKHATYASYERWMILCNDCMQVYLEAHGVSHIWLLHNADEY